MKVSNFNIFVVFQIGVYSFLKVIYYYLLLLSFVRNKKMYSNIV